MDKKVSIENAKKNGELDQEFFNDDFKLIRLFVNEGQKDGIVRLFDSLEFYGYAITKGVETSWRRGMLHRGTHAWPGADCIFDITVREKNVDFMLKELKKYRMKLPENLLFAIIVVPVERIIPDLLKFDI